MSEDERRCPDRLQGCRQARGRRWASMPVLTVQQRCQDCIDKADVDAEIKRMQDRNGRLLTRLRALPKNGDTVVIDFEGFVDGVAVRRRQG